MRSDCVVYKSKGCENPSLVLKYWLFVLWHIGECSQILVLWLVALAGIKKAKTKKNSTHLPYQFSVTNSIPSLFRNHSFSITMSCVFTGHPSVRAASLCAGSANTNKLATNTPSRLWAAGEWRLKLHGGLFLWLCYLTVKVTEWPLLFPLSVSGWRQTLRGRSLLWGSVRLIPTSSSCMKSIQIRYNGACTDIESLK